MPKRRSASRGGSAATAPVPDLASLLTPQFTGKHVGPALSHYSNAVNDYSKGDWEGCIAKAGKFVEALLKTIAVHCNVPFETGRKFKADKLMNDLSQLPYGSFNDSLRLLIPRACRVIYDIASNRGARHDPDEVNPNSMDANVAMPLASWLLAETIRFSQKGAVDPSDAELIVESLTERRYSVVEKVDGRVYLHAAKKSAVEVALVVLAQHHPKRMIHDHLVDAVKRNGFSQNNANLAVSRIKLCLTLMKLVTCGFCLLVSAVPKRLSGLHQSQHRYASARTREIWHFAKDTAEYVLYHLLLLQPIRDLVALRAFILERQELPRHAELDAVALRIRLPRDAAIDVASPMMPSRAFASCA